VRTLSKKFIPVNVSPTLLSQIKKTIVDSGSLPASLPRLVKLKLPSHVLVVLICAIDAQIELMRQRGRAGASKSGRPSIHHEVIHLIEEGALFGKNVHEIEEEIRGKLGDAAVPSRATMHRYVSMARRKQMAESEAHIQKMREAGILK
jgi:hypothetical protein